MLHLKKVFLKSLKEDSHLFTIERIGAILIGTGILSFGLHNIHQQTDITEGGVLGMILLLGHWFGIAPGIVSPLLDVLCYTLAFKFLGKRFLKLSAISTICLTGFFLLWEQFPPMLPDLSAYPFIAALAGGILVGTGVGLVVRQGGSTGGDDALALIMTKLTGCRISLAYLASDITVLLLSLTYIPLQRIIYSVISVAISSLMIDFIRRFPGFAKQSGHEISILAPDAR